MQHFILEICHMLLLKPFSRALNIKEEVCVNACVKAYSTVTLFSFIKSKKPDIQ